MEQGIPTSRTQGKQKRYLLITATTAIHDTSSPAMSDIPQGKTLLRFNNMGRDSTSSYTSDPKQQHTEATRLQRGSLPPDYSFK
jgi:hypothetical protein